MTTSPNSGNAKTPQEAIQKAFEEFFAWLAQIGQADQHQSAIDLVRKKMRMSKHMAGLIDASDLVEELKR